MSPQFTFYLYIKIVVLKTPDENYSAAPLLAYFEKLTPLTEEEKAMVLAKFQPRLYRRRQFILQAGDVCNTVNFVVSGCLRLYKVDEAGAIHIIQFATESWWISDLGSFYSTKPSEMNIDAMENAVVLQIKHDDLLALYIEAPKFDRIFRVLVENSLIRMQDRLLQNISSNARDRYECFLKQYPHLANRLPNTQIASYLGITPEFLSKIRSERVS